MNADCQIAPLETAVCFSWSVHGGNFGSRPLSRRYQPLKRAPRGSSCLVTSYSPVIKAYYGQESWRWPPVFESSFVSRALKSQIWLPTLTCHESTVMLDSQLLPFMSLLTQTSLGHNDNIGKTPSIVYKRKQSRASGRPRIMWRRFQRCVSMHMGFSRVLWISKGERCSLTR